jgi:hypothetical protein
MAQRPPLGENIRRPVAPDRLPPVDRDRAGRHIASVNKKPHKVGEAVAPYAAKKPAAKTAMPKPVELGMRQADDAAFHKVADKIFSERKELLRKLAQ